MKKVLGFVKNKLSFLAVVTLAAAVGGASTAVVMAAIPDGNGVIHACYLNSAGVSDPKGNLRIIDDGIDTCTGSETAITWDQFNAAQGTQFGDRLSLTGKDLAGTNLQFLNLSNSDFTGTSFVSANISHSNFSNSNLTNSDLDVYATHVNFTGATFTGANMAYGGAFNDSDLTDADISNQTITTSFQNSILANTDFSNSTFSGSILTGSDMSTANLSGVTWTAAICPDGTESDNNGNTCIGHLTP